MKKMTDKKFEEWPFQVPNFANVGARLKGFAELFAKASSPEEALKIWKKCTRLIESVEDKITHVSVLFSLETTNKKYEKAMKKINNAMPLLELETQKLSKAYLESPYLEFLEGKLGKLLTKMYQYELKKSDESVVALKQEESELVMKYQAATAALSFEFRGEKYNMPQMGKFLQDTDRETRKEAAEVYYSGLMAHKDELEDIFDKLWTFTERYMLLHDGPNAGYFAWSVRLDGTHNAEGPAPDGEEYFAMALFMASARWGDGEGSFNYSARAREILRHAVHQHEMVKGGEPMWDPDNALIRFVPSMKISDPSYHLPHFYELFALKADEEDRPFWKRAAEASRRYIAASAHPETGLSPEYADYEGKTVLLFGKPWVYYSDAYRVAENIALDRIWFGPTPALQDVVTRLQDFFGRQDLGDLRAYELDGTPQSEPAMHPTAIKAVLAAASAASHSAERLRFLKDFAVLPLRKGERRYYDNCLYFFCLLMLTGQYRIYC